jgi:hypothetical protein
MGAPRVNLSIKEVFNFGSDIEIASFNQSIIKYKCKNCNSFVVVLFGKE